MWKEGAYITIDFFDLALIVSMHGGLPYPEFLLCPSISQDLMKGE